MHHACRLLILVRESKGMTDRKSTRLNSSHQIISYAVFCLKKKKKLVKRTNGTWSPFFTNPMGVFVFVAFDTRIDLSPPALALPATLRQVTMATTSSTSTH